MSSEVTETTLEQELGCKKHPRLTLTILTTLFQFISEY